MQLACSLCKTFVEIGVGRGMRPSLPFVCKACKAKTRKDGGSGVKARNEIASPKEVKAPAASKERAVQRSPGPRKPLETLPGLSGSPAGPPRPAVAPRPAGPPRPAAPARPVVAARPAAKGFGAQGAEGDPKPRVLKAAADAEPVSLSDIERMHSPGVDPPPLAEVAAAPAEAGQVDQAWDSLDEPGYSVKPPEEPPPPPRAPAASAPELEPPPIEQRSSLGDPSAADLRVMEALCPTPAAPPAQPAEPEPAPRVSARARVAAARARAKGKPDRSIWDVSEVRAPDNSRVSASADDDIPVDVVIDEEAPADSGMPDLLRLAAEHGPDEEPARRERAAADLVNLNGGLFANATPLPVDRAAPAADILAPPAVSAPVLAPPVLEVVPPRAKPSEAAPELSEAEPIPGLRGPRPQVVAGWLVIGAAASLALFFGIRGSIPADAPQPSASAATEAAVDPRPPAPRATAANEGASDREPSLADEPPGATAAPAADDSASASPTVPATVTGTPAEPAPGPAFTAQPPAPVAQPPVAQPPVAQPPVAQPPVTQPPPPAPPPTGGGPFDKAAASAALAAAAGAASGCKGDDGTGGARVGVIFASSGRVTSALVESGPFVGTVTGGCIARAFRSARVPPFDGAPVKVYKQVSIR